MTSSVVVSSDVVVLAWCRAQADAAPWGLRVITRGVGLPRPRVREALGALAAEGAVARDRDGRYRLPPGAPGAPAPSTPEDAGVEVGLGATSPASAVEPAGDRGATKDERLAGWVAAQPPEVVWSNQDARLGAGLADDPWGGRTTASFLSRATRDGLVERVDRGQYRTIRAATPAPTGTAAGGGGGRVLDEATLARARAWVAGHPLGAWWTPLELAACLGSHGGTRGALERLVTDGHAVEVRPGSFTRPYPAPPREDPAHGPLYWVEYPSLDDAECMGVHVPEWPPEGEWTPAPIGPLGDTESNDGFGVIVFTPAELAISLFGDTGVWQVETRGVVWPSLGRGVARQARQARYLGGLRGCGYRRFLIASVKRVAACVPHERGVAEALRVADLDCLGLATTGTVAAATDALDALPNPPGDADGVWLGDLRHLARQVLTNPADDLTNEISQCCQALMAKRVLTRSQAAALGNGFGSFHNPIVYAEANHQGGLLLGFLDQARPSTPPAPAQVTASPPPHPAPATDPTSQASLTKVVPHYLIMRKGVADSVLSLPRDLGTARLLCDGREVVPVAWWGPPDHPCGRVDQVRAVSPTGNATLYFHPAGAPLHEWWRYDDGQMRCCQVEQIVGHLEERQEPWLPGPGTRVSHATAS